MAKVVTERPRHGHGNKSKKTGKTLSRDEIHDMGDDDADSGPRRAKVSRKAQYGSDAKSFSDLLGPLRGYLKKQVGRPWDKVYSELCQTLDRRSLAGQHIWDHVKWEVELQAYMHDGKVMMAMRYGLGHRPVEGLYVHPRTGLLCWTQPARRKYRAKSDPTLIKLGPLSELRQVDGIWYQITYRWQTRSWPHPVTGELVYGKAELVQDRKAQLSARQLKDAGLKNSPLETSVSRKAIRRLK